MGDSVWPHPPQNFLAAYPTLIKLSNLTQFNTTTSWAVTSLHLSLICWFQLQQYIFFDKNTVALGKYCKNLNLSSNICVKVSGNGSSNYQLKLRFQGYSTYRKKSLTEDHKWEKDELLQRFSDESLCGILFSCEIPTFASSTVNCMILWSISGRKWSFLY